MIKCIFVLDNLIVALQLLRYNKTRTKDVHKNISLIFKKRQKVPSIKVIFFYFNDHQDHGKFLINL